ncbi:MAG: signal peptidase I [Clostridia bacterium]|nr:signal peptidase I [Clostridia bacterium]
MTENEDIILDEEVESQEKSNEKQGKKKEKSTPLQDFVEIVDAVVIAIVSAILVLSLVFRTGYVDGPSMMSTMLDGDRYIVSGLFYTPKVGDIVVFQPEMVANDYSLWVKRVIATEDQTVDINGDGEVYVDGIKIEELYLDSHQKTLLKSHSKIEFPLTVPKGHVFVMGDNRLDSKDSRDIGCIDVRKVLGKVLLRFYPWDSFGIVD